MTIAALSNAEPSRRERFMKQLDDYARGIRARVYPARYTGGTMHAADVNGIAPFAFVEETEASRNRRVIGRTAIVAVEAIALALLAFRRFARSSVVGTRRSESIQSLGNSRCWVRRSRHSSNSCIRGQGRYVRLCRTCMPKGGFLTGEQRRRSQELRRLRGRQ